MLPVRAADASGRMMRFVWAFALAFLTATAAAFASPREATLTGLSCAACHSASGGPTDIGRAWAVPVNRMQPIGDEPNFGFRATAAYGSDRDPKTGLAKLVNDYLEATVAGKLAPNVTYAAEQRFVDGGKPGNTREAFVEYHRRRARFLVGATVLPLPIDPDRFRELHTDFASLTATVGQNPFSFAQTHPSIGGFAGDALIGLEVGAFALAGHEAGSGVAQRSTDTLLSATQRGRGYALSILRYDGTRVLTSTVDRFRREAIEGVGVFGRLRLDFAYIGGFDSDPGTGGGVGSSAGLAGVRYDLGERCFAAGRYEGVADGLGTFERLGVIGAGCRVTRFTRLTLEDAIRHEFSGTHHALNAVASFGIASSHVESSNY